MKLFRLTVIVLFLATACANQDVPGQGIRGIVLLGPHCPVVQEGEECPDTPFQTELIVTNLEGTRVIKEFSSDANGQFEVLLPVGDYLVRSPIDVQLPYCDSGPLRVAAGAMTEATVLCDTGIR